MAKQQISTSHQSGINMGKAIKRGDFEQRFDEAIELKRMLDQKWRKFACYIGFHKWNILYRVNGHAKRECRLCKKEQKGSYGYDLYGNYWEILWGRQREEEPSRKGKLKLLKGKLSQISS